MTHAQRQRPAAEVEPADQPAEPGDLHIVGAEQHETGDECGEGHQDRCRPDEHAGNERLGEQQPGAAKRAA